MIVELITKIFSFLSSSIINAVNSVLSSITEIITNNFDFFAGNQNLKAVVGACITHFIPVPQLIICISILVPLLTVNLVINLVIRIKSFIPSMGGK